MTRWDDRTPRRCADCKGQRLLTKCRACETATCPHVMRMGLCQGCLRKVRAKR